ncbi:MAG: hypothetical protein AVDCRST_MAG39-1484 [uncultured Sphingomonadaceae bacterium]|uniref:TfoX N-terminal domain-containing protein n=1 Tax=uncultured Sphingomonadaceae bacterium TaxID=169976 RepID=A0A6J4SQY1_9SPHN|nr:MAG: hypothetical protein AVDCRST_MAG39-1484 [uncultured Sphingomonadaceae bacterium]
MADDGLIDWTRDALAPLRALTHRRMLGGWTLYLDGAVFAIVAGGELWCKSHAIADPD